MQSLSLLFRRYLNPKLVSELILSLCWSAGLILGNRLAVQLPDAHFSLMRTAAQSRVSIVGMVIVAFLPLILSVAALWFSKPMLLSFIAFSKALSFGFCITMTNIAFGDAGWLVGRMLLFTDSIMAVVMLWLWFRSINGAYPMQKRDICICFAVAATVLLVDIYAVSPFMISLFQHF